MSQTSRLISGPCFAGHVLRIIFISAFSFFVWTWPVLSNPLPCKDYFDGKTVYLLDRDNHLVPHFVDTGCRLSRRQNSRWNEESGLSSTDNRYSVHHRTGGALISDISQVSSEKGDKPILLERTGHSTSGITKDVGWDEDEAILGIMSNHLVRSESATRDNTEYDDGNWREEVNAFHRENLGKAWERARESIRQAEMLQSASETLAPSVSPPPGPYSNYTGQLKHSYSVIPSPSVVVEKSPAIITQGVDSKLQDDTMESYAESDDNLDIVPPIIITPPEMDEEPEQFSNFEEFPDFEEFSDFEELFDSKEELSEYKEDLFEAEELFRSEEPFGLEELYESGELSKSEESFEPGEFFESKEPLVLEESTKDFSVEAVTLSKVSALPPISHYRPSKNFNKVLAKAVGLGLLMAIPSLIIICALSRKGQYIWIRTVNMNDLALPTSDHVRYEGGSRASENPGVTASIEGGENTATTPRGVPPGTNGSNTLERQNIGPNTMSESASNLESLERPDIGSRHGVESTSRSGFASIHGVESANRSGLASRQGLDGADFFLGSIGPVPVRKPGIFQRLFGWGVEHNDNLEGTPLHASSSTTKQSNKTRSSRTISSNRTPDPNLVSEVCERLIRERMSRLSTIPITSEDEGSGIHEVRELPPSSIRAPVTGGASGTQGSAVKRNPQGILKSPGDSYGPDALGELHLADHGDSSTREDNQAEEADSEGSSLKGKPSRLVRFDGSADKVDPQARGDFGRSSIRRYLYPAVEDDRSSLEAASASESSTPEMSDGTVIRKERKGERIGGMWVKAFSDPMVASRDSTDLGEMDVELEQQLSRDGEYVDSSRGTSIGDDSTLDGNSNDEIVIVDGQLPMEEGHKPTLESPIDIPNANTGAGRALVLNPLPRKQTIVDIATQGIDIDNNEAVVSAYGAREQLQTWDSQTSSGGSLLSTGYFTETNSSDHESVEEVENFPL